MLGSSRQARSTRSTDFRFVQGHPSGLLVRTARVVVFPGVLFQASILFQIGLTVVTFTSLIWYGFTWGSYLQADHDHDAPNGYNQIIKTTLVFIPLTVLLKPWFKRAPDTRTVTVKYVTGR